MEQDIRLRVSFKGHRKRIKLQKRIGVEGVLSLIDLWLTAAEDAPDGKLSGWDEEDIAIAGGWSAEPAQLVDALVGCGFLEKTDGCYCLHDWEDHQGWTIGSKDRSTYSRIAALIKRYGREAGLERAKTVFGIDISAFGYSEGAAAGMPPAENRHAAGMPDECRRDAPSPSPSPSPFPNKKTTPLTPLKKRGAEGLNSSFDAFWKAYPRKAKKLAALKAWKKLKNPAALLPRMLEAIERQRASPQWAKDGGQFIPYPSTWLNDGQWEDEIAKPQTRSYIEYRKAMGAPEYADDKNQRQ